jgi:hypothetical protein
MKSNDILGILESISSDTTNLREQSGKGSEHSNALRKISKFLELTARNLDSGTYTDDQLVSRLVPKIRDSIKDLQDIADDIESKK